MKNNIKLTETEMGLLFDIVRNLDELGIENDDIFSIFKKFEEKFPNYNPYLALNSLTVALLHNEYEDIDLDDDNIYGNTKVITNILIDLADHEDISDCEY